MRWLAAGFAAMALGWLGCGSRPERRDPTPHVDVIDAGAADTFANRGSGVWLRVSPDDASITIDGKDVGTAAELLENGGFVSLSAGLHQIVVRRDGYRTWRAEVTVRENTEPIDIQLEPL